MLQCKEVVRASVVSGRGEKEKGVKEERREYVVGKGGQRQANLKCF